MLFLDLSVISSVCVAENLQQVQQAIAELWIRHTVTLMFPNKQKENEAKWRKKEKNSKNERQ